MGAVRAVRPAAPAAPTGPCTRCVSPAGPIKRWSGWRTGVTPRQEQRCDWPAFSQPSCHEDGLVLSLPSGAGGSTGGLRPLVTGFCVIKDPRLVFTAPVLMFDGPVFPLWTRVLPPPAAGAARARSEPVNLSSLMPSRPALRCISTLRACKIWPLDYLHMFSVSPFIDNLNMISFFFCFPTGVHTAARWRRPALLQ